MSEMQDIVFRSMGSDIRILIEPPLLPGAPCPAEAGARERNYVEDFARRLSRFRPQSELSALNRDPGTRVPASPLLRVAVRAGLWAARISGGLIDPTLIGALESAGYEGSREGSPPASLAQALLVAPARRPAGAHPEQLWRRISVDDRSAIVARPVGVRFDTGGTGKGLCADSIAHRLGANIYRRFVVDCGGDIAIGGVGAQLEPYEVEVEHPLTGETVRSVRVAAGGVATSGLNVRVWANPDGSYAHHLLDPASGLPAWTGLIGVTALAPSALEAETLSKTALLLGPLGARGVLKRYGGIVIYDDGDVEEVGPLDNPRGLLEVSGRAA